MRTTIVAIVLAGLASPVAANGHWPGPGDRVAPHATGLHIGQPDGAPRSELSFGDPFHSTMHTLVAIFGHDVEISFPAECGAGPLVSASIPGQIDLTFQNDQFAGWMLISDDALQTRSGLGVGSSSSALSTEGPVTFFDSTIGTEFQAGALFGLLSDDTTSVRGLWSGVTCIFR